MATVRQGKQVLDVADRDVEYLVSLGWTADPAPEKPTGKAGTK